MMHIACGVPRPRLPDDGADSVVIVAIHESVG
jgi:hypothetical protein